MKIDVSGQMVLVLPAEKKATCWYLKNFVIKIDSSSGVQQEPILCPLSFQIYENDWSTDVKHKLLCYDNTVWSLVNASGIEEGLPSDIDPNIIIIFKQNTPGNPKSHIIKI